MSRIKNAPLRQRRKRILRALFLSAGITIVALCITFILLYLFVPHQRAVPVTPVYIPDVPHLVPAPPTAALPPVKLTIPTINVDTLVNPVGLTSAGDMDIDEDPTQVAWYMLGPKPGDEGSAVIAGHYGWKDGVPSIFNDLNKLAPGDTISTYSSDGQQRTFTVTRIAVYAPDQDATDVFKSDDGKAHLNLITCQGTWVKSAKSYTERLVVFTDYTE